MAGERRDGRQVGRVAGGQHQGRLETAEFGQLALEFGMQCGGAGDQPGSGRARTPLARGPGRGGGDVGVPRQAQIVVAREVQKSGRGGPGAQGTDESGVRAAARLGVDPVERVEGHERSLL